MNQREFWDWFHYLFCADVKKFCVGADPTVEGVYRYVDIVEQCRTLFAYEGVPYSYDNYMAILEGWQESEFEPDLLQWVENDMKRRGVWKGRIEQRV